MGVERSGEPGDWRGARPSPEIPDDCGWDAKVPARAGSGELERWTWRNEAPGPMHQHTHTHTYT